MKTNSTFLLKFIIHGAVSGIIVASVGSLFFSFVFFLYGLISKSPINSASEFLASMALNYAMAVLVILLVSLIPAILAGIIFSTWIHFDLKNERYSEKKTIGKGASLGFAFSLGIFAFVMWISMSYPPHGALPTGGILTLIKNYADIGILGISFATLAGTWAGKKLTKFAHNYSTFL